MFYIRWQESKRAAVEITTHLLPGAFDGEGTVVEVSSPEIGDTAFNRAARLGHSAATRVAIERYCQQKSFLVNCTASATVSKNIPEKVALENAIGCDGGKSQPVLLG